MDNKITTSQEMESMYEKKLEMDEHEAKDFLKNNSGVWSYISKHPKKQQLYFLFKLILNRKSFRFHLSEQVMLWFSNLFCCCKKKCVNKHSYAIAKQH